MIFRTAARGRKTLTDECGDMYFEYLICLFLFIAALWLTIQVLSAVRLKFWLDGRTTAIIRNVQINGEITDTAEAILEEVTDRLGDETFVEWDAPFIPGTGKIQLGDSIRLRISSKIVLFRIGAREMKITISSETVGTSEIYWKDP